MFLSLSLPGVRDSKLSRLPGPGANTKVMADPAVWCGITGTQPIAQAIATWFYR